MNETMKDGFRRHARKLMLGGTGALLALSLFTLGSTLLDDGTADSDARGAQLISQLDADVTKAQAALDAKHDALLAQLPSVDVDRIDRDRATGRSLLLSLADSSATGSVEDEQRQLDARYGYLDSTSRVLTEFVPDWMATTGAAKGEGTVFTLDDLSIDVGQVQGLDYGYVGIARFDPVPVEADGSTAKSEYVVFTYSTGQDGVITAADAYRASSRTRDALLAAAADGQDPAAAPTDGAGPTSTPPSAPARTQIPTPTPSG